MVKKYCSSRVVGELGQGVSMLHTKWFKYFFCCMYVLNFIIGIGLVVVAVLIYPHLPQKIPTHWNGAAQIDGWGSKINIFLPVFLPFLGAFFHPHIIDQQFQVGSRANSNFRLFALAGMIVLWLAAAFLMWIMYRYAGR